MGRRGLIVQVGTVGGVVAFGGQAFYHASKFALEGFTESLSHEIPPSWNIRFLIIQPGGVKTNYGTSSLVKIPAHPAYNDPSFGTRKLEAFFDNPAFGDYMADVDVVAGIILEAVRKERRGEVGLRVPVGPDSWSLIKGKYEGELVGLEKVKELSWGTGNERLLEVIGFLDG
ncbi:fb12f6b1-eaa6-45ef-a4dc-5dc766683557 [Sclerotinia trifoliorum]|uniref:Fb12f6b1-eaa6-45ef-a4dc-5dc766683557 n=1 Tax=Sclerotinia trifoliorum TaxID=28548 RepID=A0A8H2W1K9_9HELO|nr:fb12f6b1-eaa6-45ef-a4dc-5dc766683557 [Sclerotinia trifoliorum]